MCLPPQKEDWQETRWEHCTAAGCGHVTVGTDDPDPLKRASVVQRAHLLESYRQSAIPRNACNRRAHSPRPRPHALGVGPTVSFAAVDVEPRLVLRSLQYPGFQATKELCHAANCSSVAQQCSLFLVAGRGGQVGQWSRCGSTTCGLLAHIGDGQMAGIWTRHSLLLLGFQRAEGKPARLRVWGLGFKVSG